MEKITANEFTNVRDIKDIFLYTKDNYIMAYLQVFPFNLDLLPLQEQASLTRKLAASFEGDRKDFAYFTYPREIDLDDYKNNLKNRHVEELTNVGRRHLLTIMLQQAATLATNGENYEHQHFLKIWRMIGSDKKECEREVRTRITEFYQRYSDCGIKVEILKADAILKMCNLFGNAVMAPFEVPSDLQYEPIFKL